MIVIPRAPRLFFRAPAALVLPLLIGALACQEQPLAPPRANLLPETEITGKAPEAYGIASYRVEMLWNGIDRDGRVVGYYFAWDDTAGAAGNSAWRWTTASDTTFVVSADSRSDDGTPYFGYHTFWVRAVDDEGALDPTPAYRTFTATTVAPVTTITEAPAQCFCFYGEEGPSKVRIAWKSLDPDGEVVGYWVKWDVAQSDHPTAQGPDPSEHGWTFLPAGENSVTAIRERAHPSCQPPNSFAVFAVDDAGAIEQRVNCPRNWTCWCPTEELSGPGLCVNGGPLGIRSNPPHWLAARSCDPEIGESGAFWYSYSFDRVAEMIAGNPVHFRWTRLPGGATPLWGYQYAVDDPTAWSPIDATVTSYPPPDSLWTPEPGHHLFYVRAVDVLGNIDQGGFQFDVIALPGPGAGRRYLLIRDVSGRDDFYPEWDDFSFGETEEFWYDVLAGFRGEVWNTRTRGSSPRLHTVVQYSTLIWEVGSEGTFHEDLASGAELISEYVRAGGNVLFLGMNPVYAMLVRGPTSGPGTPERVDVCGFGVQTGAWLTFDPRLCLGVEPETHPLLTRFGARRMMIPVVPPGGIYQWSDRSRMVRGALSMDPSRWSALQVDSEKAGGWRSDIDWLPAASVSSDEYLEPWVERLYRLDSADPRVDVKGYVIGFLADGMRNPRRPESEHWGTCFFLGLHPFFLEEEDAAAFMRELLEDRFGEPYDL